MESGPEEGLKAGYSSQRARRGLALACGLALLLSGCSGPRAARTPGTSAGLTTQFIYTSDPHYGITRKAFQGSSDVDAGVVNTALVTRMNALPSVTFPSDGGLQAGQRVGAVDFIVETGDIANRAEGTRPEAGIPAVKLWAEFQAGYLDALTLKSPTGISTPIYLVPGNHDCSNAIGYYKPSIPFPIDPTAYIEIYNRMMRPAEPLTVAAWGSTQATAGASYAAHQVYYSKDLNGVHLLFINMWPGSAARAWMEKDLAQVNASTPVAIFTHDPPAIDHKHLTNPNGIGDINARDAFENLVVDTGAIGKRTGKPSATSQQRALVTFLKAHKNIVAYFHGHDNRHEAYVWKGPDGDLALNTFRVDSPMKGAISATDETQLSFQVITLDAQAKTMTVREYLWNNPHPWGASTTVSLLPRNK